MSEPDSSRKKLIRPPTIIGNIIYGVGASPVQTILVPSHSHDSSTGSMEGRSHHTRHVPSVHIYDLVPHVWIGGWNGCRRPCDTIRAEEPDMDVMHLGVGALFILTPW